MPNNVIMAIQTWPSAMILGAPTSLAGLMATLQNTKELWPIIEKMGDNQLGINTTVKLGDHQYWPVQYWIINFKVH